ncbi:4-(cytidine 5'-diphospho)-2-C-methyl-D-erythritol kinase [Jiulongibacter sp. NS-SX5]|uniref:4-(cytidine 5'-diphospho)-2-C-methyl-D-erythritol kinase n=1 Tax=Jiulongibacter sp. NS-SX5 TaxID=3463854 RepID=UPI004057FA16
MICFPNAKINIGLNIVEKREDGFHNIESVFYPIKWCDALEAVKSDSFEFKSTGLEIPGDSENNLIVKAYKLLEKHIPNGTAPKIHLHKVIPMGAGLGGGSADGAFALKLLNELFNCGVKMTQLQKLAAELGSDCPFFIENKPVYCYDRGIKFENIDLDLSGNYMVCVNPGIHISTAEAYGSITPRKPKENLTQLITNPLSEWKSSIFNDFEEPLSKKYPLIKDIKNGLYDLGATYASMTGSGSTVYGIFKTKPDLQNQFQQFSVYEGKL